MKSIIILLCLFLVANIVLCVPFPFPDDGSADSNNNSTETNNNSSETNNNSSDSSNSPDTSSNSTETSSNSPDTSSNSTDTSSTNSTDTKKAEESSSDNNEITTELTGQKRINTCPIIGVLVQKITDKGLIEEVPELKGKSFISASYIKWLESAGARVVAFHPNMTEAKIEQLFKSVSGILLPGGEINLNNSGYATLGRKLYKMAKDANADGVNFPIFGICRGMQALAVFEELNNSSLMLTDSRNYTTSVHYTLEMTMDDFLKDMDVPLMAAVEAYNITSHFHKYGIPPKAMKKDSMKTYKVLGTSKDRNGKEFVSIMKGTDLPFFGVQFHPEKPAFEWAENVDIPHDPQAICFGQYLANKFVDEARKNTKHAFDSYKAESEASVYGDRLVDVSLYAPMCHSPFQQIYVYDA